MKRGLIGVSVIGMRLSEGGELAIFAVEKELVIPLVGICCDLSLLLGLVVVRITVFVKHFTKYLNSAL